MNYNSKIKNMNGFLLIDKENSWSSRDVCNKIQGLFHMKKVGHIGTLDPFATGLLIVSLGKATKAGQFLESADKTYLATLKLGESRDGGDITGETLLKKEVPNLNKELILDVFNKFIGEIDQIPPLKSAVHFNGERLYRYAQKNEIVTPPSRKVNINSIELVDYSIDEITFRCNVSKGTYIRVLGEDIAKALHTVGYLSSLRRESISSISVINAKKINEISENDVISISDTLVNIHHVYIDDILADKAKRGVPIFFKNLSYDKILLVDNKGEAIAVYYKLEGDKYLSLRGLF